MSQIETEIGPVVGRLQTDTFCEGCGYNLHTQAVSRDDRLGLLVCRCPECGRYAAAGQGATASRAWLNRLATSFLVLWIVFGLGGIALVSFFEGLIPYGYSSDSVEWTAVTTGIASHYPYLRQTSPRQTYRYYPKHYGPDQAEWEQRHDREFVLLVSIAAALAIGMGCCFAAFFWHARGWRRAWAFLPPILACAVASLIWISDPMMEFVQFFGLERIGGFLAVELLGVAFGLAVGRPVARGLLTLFIPPKARQHFAFMWTTDGKKLAG